MDVELEVDFGSSFDQPARTFRKHVAALSDGILVEEHALLSYFERDIPVELTAVPRAGIGFHDGRSDVMDDLIALGRDDLHSLNIAVFGETGIDQNVRPPVRTLGLHDHVFRESHDHIRLADLPRLPVREGAGRRHVGGIALRRAGVHPLDDGGDFLVRQRRVVTEMLDTHVLVDEPRRHLPSQNLLLDRPRPGPRLLVRHQRHGRKSAHPMTDLATLLEDGRHVLGEGDLFLGHCRGGHYHYSGNGHPKAYGGLHLTASYNGRSRYMLLTVYHTSFLPGKPPRGA